MLMTSSHASQSTSIVGAIGRSGFARTAAALLRRFADRRRQRLALGELDDRLLRDIGLTREEAHAESSRYFWQ